jgi:hypothetical protein
LAVPADMAAQSSPTCVTSPEQASGACAGFSSTTPVPQGRLNASGGVYPNYCKPNTFLYYRDESCRQGTHWYETYRIVDGVRKTTGRIDFIVFSYQYMAHNQPNFAHELGMEVTQAWGEAMPAVLAGAASQSGECVPLPPNTFGPSGLPVGAKVGGTAQFDTTAKAPGAIGHCETQWTLTFTNLGFPNTVYTGYKSVQNRCDNATGAVSYPGCVISHYPEAVFYSRSAYGTLASHVERAQASGLPGGTISAPLVKADRATEDRNRALACGSAPSLAGLSCDEYPPAVSTAGLTAGGTRRTFDNCNFTFPPATGPLGVSVCMINEKHNDAQGGLHSQFFREWRVLVGDPWRVRVVA